MIDMTGIGNKKGFAVAVVMAAVLLAAVAAGSIVGCTPKPAEAPATTESAVENPFAGQPANWSMSSECSICHDKEATTMESAACPQASKHAGLSCVQCHTAENELASVHEGITLGDEPASEASIETVASTTCEDPECHGTLEEMAQKTVDSIALTDSLGNVVNPHDRPENERHSQYPMQCTDCHRIHSQELVDDAMAYCTQCHHRGTFTCGNCHSISEQDIA